MNTQNLLTLSIDAIALSFAAIMIIDFAVTISKAWCKSGNHKPSGMCAETLAPIFEDVPEFEMATNGCHLEALAPTLEEVSEFVMSPIGLHLETLAPTRVNIPEVEMCAIGLHLAGFSIRELKKQASVAKIKNYSVLTKSQLVEALTA